MRYRFEIFVGPSSEDKTAPTVGFIDRSLYHMGTFICILLFVTTAEKRNKSRPRGPRMTKKVPYIVMVNVIEHDFFRSGYDFPVQFLKPVICCNVYTLAEA